MDYLTIIFAIIGAVSAVTVETIFRTYPASFIQVAAFTVPLAVVINFGVFHTMKMGHSLIEGLVIWTVMTSALRVLSTWFVLGESPNTGSWIAFGLVIAASFVSKFWR